jgi:hypothetical protein
MRLSAGFPSGYSLINLPTLAIFTPALMRMSFDFELEYILIFNYFLSFYTWGLQANPLLCEPTVWPIFNGKFSMREIKLRGSYYHINP